MKQALRPCGTRAAYRRHVYYGEVPCPPCLEAERSGRRTNHPAQRRRVPLEPVTLAQARIEDDMQELIHLLELAFATPPDTDQGRLAAEDAVSAGDRAPGEPRAGSRIRSGSRVGNPGANPGPGTAVSAS